MDANERLQFLILIGLSIGVVVLTAIGYFSDPHLFRRFLGKINPLFASVVVVFLGGILLPWFMSRGWFVIYRTGNTNRFLYSSGLAVLLGAIMILVDLKIVFPQDINVLLPRSLLFYPVAAYAVEILFHSLPLAILLFSLTSLSKSLSFEAIIWPSILVVSLAEPIFQTILGSREHPSSAIAYVALHIWAINLIQLWLFKRYDFISMYSFRLVYYLIWHIVWGDVRIRLLF